MQSVTEGNVTANYLPQNFGGWVVFKNGKMVRSKHNKIKVFATAEAAIAAGKKSTLGEFKHLGYK